MGSSYSLSPSYVNGGHWGLYECPIYEGSDYPAETEYKMTDYFYQSGDYTVNVAKTGDITGSIVLDFENYFETNE